MTNSFLIVGNKISADVVEQGIRRIIVDHRLYKLDTIKAKIVWVGSLRSPEDQKNSSLICKIRFDVNLVHLNNNITLLMSELWSCLFKKYDVVIFYPDISVQLLKISMMG